VTSVLKKGGGEEREIREERGEDSQKREGGVSREWALGTMRREKREKREFPCREEGAGVYSSSVELKKEGETEKKEGEAAFVEEK